MSRDDTKNSKENQRTRNESALLHRGSLQNGSTERDTHGAREQRGARKRHSLLRRRGRGEAAAVWPIARSIVEKMRDELL